MIFSEKPVPTFRDHALRCHFRRRPMTFRPRRSALYLPGSNARAIEKARTLPADVVILDLEDSVAPETKAQTRAMACEAALAGPDAVLVPKVASPGDLAAYRSAVNSQTPLWAMIETCQAVFSLGALA